MRAALLLTALAVAAADSFHDKITELAAEYPSDDVRDMEEPLLKDLNDEKDGRNGHDHNQKALFETIAVSSDAWTLYAAVKGTEMIYGKPPGRTCIFSIELQASEAFSTEGLYKINNVDALRRPIPLVIVAAASAGVNKECGGDLPPEFTEFGGQFTQIMRYVHTTLHLHSSNLFGSTQIELVAVSKSNPREILFAHRQGPTGFSSLFDEYKPEEEDAFVTYLESEARPVLRERCVQDFIRRADEYRRGLTAAQRAQEEDAAAKAVEMEERTRVGIENGGPLAGGTIVLEDGQRQQGRTDILGAAEFAGRDDIVDYYDQDGEVLLYGNPARMDELRRMLRKELRPNMGQDLECIANIKNALDELGVKTVHELEVILRDLGAYVIYMKSSDAEQRLRDALGTDWSVDLEDQRYFMLVADHLGRPSEPSHRFKQFVQSRRAYGESYIPMLAANGWNFDSVDAEPHTVYWPGTNTMRDTLPDGTRVFEVEGFMSQPDTNVPEPRDDEDLPECKWPDAVPPPLKPAGYNFRDIDAIVEDNARMRALREAYQTKFETDARYLRLQNHQQTHYAANYPQYTRNVEGLLRDCLRSGYANVGRNDVPGYGTARIPFPLVPEEGEEHLHGHLPRVAPADESESESGEAADHEEF